MDDERAGREVLHGKHLADNDPVRRWGWGTPAGRLRAVRRAQMIMDAAQMAPGLNVLELGCGTGLFTEMFAESGANIVAIDISPDLLGVAQRRNLPPAQVQFLEGRFEDSTFDGPFDAVIGSSVLHHLETGTALPRIFALLKPGGILSFAEPNRLNPQVFLERKCRRFFSYVSPDETAFMRSRLRRDLHETGFEQIQIRPFDWLHPATPRVLIPAVASIGALLERIWPVREFAGSLHIRARRPDSEQGNERSRES